MKYPLPSFIELKESSTFSIEYSSQESYLTINSEAELSVNSIKLKSGQIISPDGDIKLITVKGGNEGVSLTALNLFTNSTNNSTGQIGSADNQWNDLYCASIHTSSIDFQGDLTLTSLSIKTPSSKTPLTIVRANSGGEELQLLSVSQDKVTISTSLSSPDIFTSFIRGNGSRGNQKLSIVSDSVSFSSFNGIAPKYSEDDDEVEVFPGSIFIITLYEEDFLHTIGNTEFAKVGDEITIEPPRNLSGLVNTTTNALANKCIVRLLTPSSSTTSDKRVLVQCIKLL